MVYFRLISWCIGFIWNFILRGIDKVILAEGGGGERITEEMGFVHTRIAT